LLDRPAVHWQAGSVSQGRETSQFLCQPCRLSHKKKYAGCSHWHVGPQKLEKRLFQARKISVVPPEVQTAEQKGVTCDH
jgi:hypothetical protein